MSTNATNMTALLSSLTRSDIDALLNFGLLIESLTYPSFPMSAAISRLASPTSPYNLTLLLNNTISSPDAKVAILNAVIPTLPHDVTSGKYITGYYIVTTISCVAVGLRLYARNKYTGKIRTEDKWAVVAAVFAILIAIQFTLCLSTGRAGHHIYDVSFNDFTRWLRFLTVGEMFFCVCLIPVKIVFLIFYHSLSPNHLYRRLLLVVGVFVVLLTISGLLLMFFQCRPFDIWNHLFTAVCIDRVRAFTIWAVLTIISDFAILLLPISEVIKLRLRRREMWMIVTLFSAGGVVCIASILRLITLNDVFTATDKIYTVGAASIWSLVELNLALICSCLPALKHLLLGRSKCFEAYLPSFVVRSIRWGIIGRRTSEGKRSKDSDLLRSTGSSGATATERTGTVVTNVTANKDKRVEVEECGDADPGRGPGEDRGKRNSRGGGEIAIGQKILSGEELRSFVGEGEMEQERAREADGADEINRASRRSTLFN